MTDHLTITDRVLQADEVAVERFLKAVRAATRHHGEDALLADMLDHLIAYHNPDNPDDKAYSAGEMRDVAYKLECAAERQRADAEHPYLGGRKRRTWP